jgi:hypothetical protein
MITAAQKLERKQGKRQEKEQCEDKSFVAVRILQEQRPQIKNVSWV